MPHKEKIEKNALNSLRQIRPNGYVVCSQCQVSVSLAKWATHKYSRCTKGKKIEDRIPIIAQISFYS